MPLIASGLTLIVIVEFAVPPPGGCTTRGVNVPVTFAGKPVTLSAVGGRLHTPILVTLAITVFDSPLLIARRFGDTEIVKSPGSLITSSVTITQCVPEELSLAVTFSW